MPELKPRVGTKITGKGVVTFRDVTKYGLHRMRVEADGYPDLATWFEMIGKPSNCTYYYTESKTITLHLFWKE
ncbi:MAG: hypothetical protein HY867_06250 [Chloroflexi bacterium]|nr:hypothetical protein [Chloroflexota bacterium]